MGKRLLSLNLALLLAVLLVLPGLTLTSSAAETWLWGEDGYIKVQVEQAGEPELITIRNVVSYGELKLYEAFLYHEDDGNASVLATKDYVATGYQAGSQTVAMTASVKDVAAKTAADAPVLVPEKFESTTDAPLALCIVPNLRTQDGKDVVVLEANAEGEVTLPATSAFTPAGGQEVLIWEACREDLDDAAAGEKVKLTGNTVWLAGEGICSIAFHTPKGITRKAYSSMDEEIAYMDYLTYWDNSSMQMRYPRGWNSEEDGSGNKFTRASLVSEVLGSQEIAADVYMQYMAPSDERYYILECDYGLESGYCLDIVTLPESGSVQLPTKLKGGVEALNWSVNTTFYPAGDTVTLQSGLRVYGYETNQGVLYACLDGNGGTFGNRQARYDFVYCNDGTGGILSRITFSEYLPNHASSVVIGYEAVGSGTRYDLDDDVLSAIQAEKQEGSRVARFKAVYRTEPVSGDYLQYFGNGALTRDGETFVVVAGLSATASAAAGTLFQAPQGKEFDGWNTEAGGYGTAYAAGATVPLEEVTALYAQWKDAPVQPPETPDEPSHSTGSSESSKDETTTVKVTQQEIAQAKGEAVALPMEPVAATTDRAEAPTVVVDLPSGTTAKVSVPVENVTPGTVAVLVKADGTEEIVRTSVVSEDGLILTVEDGATLKIVDNSKEFDDVADSSWCADAVAFASSRELFQGTSSTQFSPDSGANRAMVVTVLARLEGENTDGGDSWYDQGRQWAMENDISDGSNMDAPITREQLATMLYRYAQQRGMDVTQSVSLEGFNDAASVSGYAAEAMRWAVANGIITGKPNQTLDPQAGATRAQTAAMLMRFCQIL